MAIHASVCISIVILNVLVLWKLYWNSWFALCFGIGSLIYVVVLYIKLIIHLIVDYDTIFILSRLMYENQQLKRRIVYLTNQHVNQHSNQSMDSQ
jgi:hypothetical protein